MADEMRAVVVDEAAPGRLTVARTARPAAGGGQALVQVAAISLNRGEVKTAMEAASGWRPGWDFAGTVIEAVDGGPPVGTRVVGGAAAGAWAEFQAAAPFMLAPLPDAVSFEAAATLPVAGLTALYGLRKGPPPGGRGVLVTGATGGVGVYAVQLAAGMGDAVTAWVRSPASEALMRELGAAHVVVGETLPEGLGPFDLILESVGGRALATAMASLAPGGTCVTLGNSEGAPIVSFDASKFRVGGTSLYGLAMFYEMQREPPSVGLAQLAGLIADGKLKPIVERRGRIEDIAQVARELIDRKFTGKAVLTF
jgi:NADPH:quinone reductase-like Zn-dependent oxidoreductase